MKTGRSIVFGILFAMGLLFSSCTADKKPSSAEKVLANVAKDILIPFEAENVKNPVPLNADTLETGRRIYMQSCALCHGENGHGQTTLGRSMYPPAMDLTSPHVQHWDDGEMFWIIQNGARMTGMPSWKETISTENTWKLVHYLREFSDSNAKTPETVEPKPPQKAREQLLAYGRTLFRQEGCFMCHQLDGDGGSVGPDLTIEAKRGRTADWLVGHFKNPGAFVSGSIMPSFKNLTDEQLQALTVFLMNQYGNNKAAKAHE